MIRARHRTAPTMKYRLAEFIFRRKHAGDLWGGIINCGIWYRKRDNVNSKDNKDESFETRKRERELYLCCLCSYINIDRGHLGWDRFYLSNPDHRIRHCPPPEWMYARACKKIYSLCFCSAVIKTHLKNPVGKNIGKRPCQHDDRHDLCRRTFHAFATSFRLRIVQLTFLYTFLSDECSWCIRFFLIASFPIL